MVSAAFLSLISLAILGVFLYHILGPREVWDFDQVEGHLTTLRKRQDRLLRTLKDLEYERELGNLSDEEFYRLRHDFKRRAIDAMREMDRARGARLRRLSRQRATAPPSLRRQVEALVVERKKRS